MNSRVEQSRSKRVEQSRSKSVSAREAALYVVAVLLVGAGVFAYTWFDQWASPLRVAVVVGGLLAGLAVFMMSGKGRDTLSFLSESRFELRKVVWPTRQEAMRLTWVVIVVVIIMSLILAAFDAIIQWAVRLLLGH